LTSQPHHAGTEIVGWRTRILPGFEAEYTRIHSRIPDAVATALRTAGVVEWRIWRDGCTLFHTIETTQGRDEMGRRMAALGPIDPAWDALIATMLDDSDNAGALLPLVWGMDLTDQFS
jgi:L-rhamnose mutarotase